MSMRPCFSKSPAASPEICRIEWNLLSVDATGFVLRSCSPLFFGEEPVILCAAVIAGHNKNARQHRSPLLWFSRVHCSALRPCFGVSQISTRTAMKTNNDFAAREDELTFKSVIALNKDWDIAMRCTPHFLSFYHL